MTQPVRHRLAPLAAIASLFAAALPLAVHAAPPKAGEWPEFHGPNRDNISTETGLLKEWPAGGPALAWRNNDMGGGFSSVSVVGGRVYCAGETGAESFVLALDASNGKQVWRSRLGKSGGGGGHPGPRATPTVDGEYLYMIGQYGDVVCYALADGKEVWRKNLNSDFGGKMMSGWGNSESLLIVGEKLLCTPGGRQGTALALDKKTGNPIWQSKEFTDSAAYMAPVVVDVGGIKQAVLLTDASVAGVAVEDGKLLWKHARPGQTAVIPTPIVKVQDPSTAHVFVTSGYGIGCDLFEIKATGGKFAVTQKYSNKNMINHHGGVILLDGYVYGYSDPARRGGGRGGRGGPPAPAPAPDPTANPGGWSCLEFLTGKVKWNAANANLGKGTISYADGRFYLREEGRPGTIVLIDASPEGWKERGRFQQPDRSDKNAWPHLVIAGGKLFVRDQNLLLAYDVKAK